MKDPKDRIRIFIVCAVMAALGLVFRGEENARHYSVFLIAMAFAALLFLLAVIDSSNLSRNRKTFAFFLTALAATLWLGWAGVPLNGSFTLLLLAAVCAAWFAVSIARPYFHQRQVVRRWNAAYAVWRSGGSAERYLEAIERCEAELEIDETAALLYDGIPLKDYIAVHKVSLLKEMGRAGECLALLQRLRPAIQNEAVLKALREIEAELSGKL